MSAPDPTLDWSNFPSSALATSTPIYRIHGAGHGFALFNSAPTFRFNPPATHSAKFGTCYFALEPIGAFTEVLGRTRMVEQALIDSKALTQAFVGSERMLANLTDRRAIGYEVDNAFSSCVDYGPCQQLAVILREAGFDGIEYLIRHDPRQQLRGIALFGDPLEDPSGFTNVKTDDIPDYVVDQAVNEFGMLVMGTPMLP